MEPASDAPSPSTPLGAIVGIVGTLTVTVGWSLYAMIADSHPFPAGWFLRRLLAWSSDGTYDWRVLFGLTFVTVVTCVASQKFVSSTACIISSVSPLPPRWWATIMVRDDRNVHPQRFEPGAAAPGCCVDSLAGVFGVIPIVTRQINL